MKLCVALVAASLCAFALTPASAGTQTGIIQGIWIRDSDGLIYLTLSGTASGRPPCAVGTTYWMIPHEATDTGKRLFSALLAAQLSGRTVVLEGKNTCDRWVDGEDIDTVSVHGF